MRGQLTFAVVVLFLAAASADPEPGRRKGKLFPIFQIVRFNNDPCDGGNRNGTCYTSEECDDKGGTNSGSCADGYGVCCTFEINCGGMSNENCTYVESNSPTAGGCSHKICPCNNNICQLRLEFETFTIANPSTDATVTTKIRGGVLDIAAGASASTASQCLTDSFVVTNAAGRSSDVLCGVNTGQHLYVETNDGCTDLNFQLGTGGTTRTWNIKVIQYGCESPVRAPKGCDQFYYGLSTGTVESFNYNNGQGRHLANQDQSICVRRERGSCRICWTAAAATALDISGTTAATAVSDASKCCGYGTDGLQVNGYDCVHIPGARNPALATFVPSNRCGQSANNVGAANGICSTVTPFLINFRSDAFEFTDGAAIAEAGDAQTGFRYTFTQDSTNCS